MPVSICFLVAHIKLATTACLIFLFFRTGKSNVILEDISKSHDPYLYVSQF